MTINGIIIATMFVVWYIVTPLALIFWGFRMIKKVQAEMAYEAAKAEEERNES